MSWDEQAACKGHDPEWQASAACRDQPPYLWDTDLPDSWREGRRTCIAVCPVRDACLAYALGVESGAAASRWGIYGGLTPDERAMRPDRRHAAIYQRCDTCDVRMTRQAPKPVKVAKQATERECLGCWQRAREIASRPAGNRTGPRGDEFTDDEARAAHNRWNAGEKDPITRAGERRYQRDASRAYRKRTQVAAS